MKKDFFVGLTTGVLLCAISYAFSATTVLQDSYDVANAKLTEASVRFNKSFDRQVKEAAKTTQIKGLDTELTDARNNWDASVVRYCNAVSKIYGGDLAGPKELECRAVFTEAFIKINEVYIR